MWAARRARVPGTPPMAASPGMRPLGQLTLAHDLQALAAGDAETADDEQRAATERDQDAGVDAAVVDRRVGARRDVVAIDLVRVGRPLRRARVRAADLGAVDLVRRAEVLHD